MDSLLQGNDIEEVGNDIEDVGNGNIKKRSFLRRSEKKNTIQKYSF